MYILHVKPTEKRSPVDSTRDNKKPIIKN